MSTRLALASVTIVCLLGAATIELRPADQLPRDILRNASSLYLREAASGPIRWQPWGADTFALARKLNRPILIDIGAMWCHWCHVMDEITYADPKVAEAINRGFVPIKVDTDERPDIDAFYQDAAMTFGVGGWPLTCFTAPDGAPVFIAGYMVPAEAEMTPQGRGMLWVLNRVTDAYATDPGFTKFAHQVAAEVGLKSQPTGDKSTLDALRNRILLGLSTSYDSEAGGFGSGPGPRFYDFPAIRLALAHGFYGHRDYTQLAVETLKKIAAGGVYDQLGGGFHRYSTDPHWGVPHFEKMGYDQAMALQAYAEAVEASGDSELSDVLRSLLSYTDAVLLDPATHAFHAHQDADAFKGDDGSYYTWTAEEVKGALAPEQARAALIYFGFEDSPARAPGGRVVLRRAVELPVLAKRLGVPEDRAKALVEKAKAAMLAARVRRKPPAVDHAIMTDRNALMVSGYIAASHALRDPKLAAVALEDLDFLLAHMRAPDGGFYHVWSKSRAEVPGLAADQVYMIEALIEAWQVSANDKYLDSARAVAKLVMDRFRDPKTGLIVNRAPADQGSVVASGLASPQVLYDAPMPSVQATAASALAMLAEIDSDQLEEKAAGALLDAAPAVAAPMPPANFGALGLALERAERGDTSVAIAGGDAADRTPLADVAFGTYRPFKTVIQLRGASDDAKLPPAMRAMVAASKEHRSAIAFVCAGTACANPVGKPERLAEVIRTFGVTSGSKQGFAQK